MESKLQAKKIDVFKTGPLTGQPRGSIYVKLEDGQLHWVSTEKPPIIQSISGLKDGDIVEFDYLQKGNFYNLTTPVAVMQASAILSEEPPEDEGGYAPEFDPQSKHFLAPRKNRLISRQSSLKAAVDYMNHLETVGTPVEAIQTVLRVADMFDEWVNLGKN